MFGLNSIQRMKYAHQKCKIRISRWWKRVHVEYCLKLRDARTKLVACESTRNVNRKARSKMAKKNQEPHKRKRNQLNVVVGGKCMDNKRSIRGKMANWETLSDYIKGKPKRKKRVFVVLCILLPAVCMNVNEWVSLANTLLPIFFLSLKSRAYRYTCEMA